MDNSSIKTRIEQKLIPNLTKIMNNYELPGFAVGIVKGDEILLAKGFGVCHLEKQDPVTPNTNFHLASISKTFVALSIMQLVESGKITLADPVVKHVPYFTVDDPSSNAITVKQMLNHVSRIPDLEDDGYGWENPEFDNQALENYVKSVKNLKLLSHTEPTFLYSNITYEILGDLIAKVSGRTFEEYVREFIFEPLNMDQSSFLLKKSPPENEALPHVHLPHMWVPDQQYPYNRAHAPSSTLHSNIQDMCKYIQMHLNKGQLSGANVLHDSSIDLMWKREFETNTNMTHNASVGLSWFSGDYKNHQCVGHSGSDRGFQSQLLLFPQDSLGLIVLINAYPSPAWVITATIIDALYNELGDNRNLKIPITYPLGKILMKSGIQEALDFYSKAKSNNMDEFHSDVEQFLFLVFVLKNIMNMIPEAKEILDLTVKEFPNSMEAKQLRESLQ